MPDVTRAVDKGVSLALEQFKSASQRRSAQLCSIFGLQLAIAAQLQRQLENIYL
jgi:hypothetical protein